MNYTPNHHMPQWVASDRIRMEDFNQMSKDIEAGLDKALAQDTGKPYVVGSYSGTGLQTQTIELGFRPSFLIISGITQTTSSEDPGSVFPYLAVTAESENIGHRMMFLNVGFAVFGQVELSGCYLPNLNEIFRHYDYIAFR